MAEKLAPDKRHSFTHGGQKVFEWDQTLDEVNIYVDLPANVPKKLFYCKIQSAHIEVGIKGNPPYLNHDLACPVKTDSSFWTLGNVSLFFASFDFFFLSQFFVFIAIFFFLVFFLLVSMPGICQQYIFSTHNTLYKIILNFFFLFWCACMCPSLFFVFNTFYILNLQKVLVLSTIITVNSSYIPSSYDKVAQFFGNIFVENGKEDLYGLGQTKLIGQLAHQAWVMTSGNRVDLVFEHTSAMASGGSDMMFRKYIYLTQSCYFYYKMGGAFWTESVFLDRRLTIAFSLLVLIDDKMRKSHLRCSIVFSFYNIFAFNLFNMKTDDIFSYLLQKRG
ncbi:unnamed protein product [Musa textilis]